MNPEREFGDRFTNQILYEGIRGEMYLGEGVLITELAVPADFVGQTLGQRQLPRKHGVTVVAIRAAIRHDGLSYEEVRQALREFVFNVNVPTRVGFPLA